MPRQGRFLQKSRSVVRQRRERQRHGCPGERTAPAQLLFLRCCPFWMCAVQTPPRSVPRGASFLSSLQIKNCLDGRIQLLTSFSHSCSRQQLERSSTYTEDPLRRSVGAGQQPDFTLEQRFLLLAILPSRSTPYVWRRFWLPQFEGWVLLASGGWKPGMLLNILNLWDPRTPSKARSSP